MNLLLQCLKNVIGILILYISVINASRIERGIFDLLFGRLRTCGGCYVVICELVSMCILFPWLSTKNVIFYCYHPDQLLTAPGGCLKQLYRTPLNYLEEFTTGLATKIFVNSIYTLQVFKNTFKRLNVEPEILYPSLHTDFIDSIEIVPLNQVLDTTLPNDCTVLLSVNRYERKKHLLLALKTFSELKRFVDVDEYRKMYLIMAGGYDKRVLENVEYYSELVQHAKDLEIEKQVIFLRSPTDCEKMSLLTHCSLLIYTPPNEHFGIVPVEAMYFAKPVFAHNSGSPRETVVDGETGYLVAELSAHAFAEKAAILVKNKNLRIQFVCGRANRDESPRFLGGETTQSHEFPWLVNIYFDFDRQISGILINDRYVLTAGSEIIGSNVHKIKVAMGAYDRCHVDTSSANLSVDAVTVYPEFIGNTKAHDLALIRLSRPIKFEKRISPVCLPNPGSTYLGQVGTLVGWPKINADDIETCLPRKLGLPVLGHSECIKSGIELNRFYADSGCVGVLGGKSIVCSEDLGSPILYRAYTGVYDLIGILSSGNTCTDDSTISAVYTKVGPHLDWILQNTKDACYCTK